MTFVDWVIVVVLVLSVLEGLSLGFFRSISSLGGLLLGLVLAAWNYARVAALIMPVARIEALADTIAFLFIAIAVMGLVGWLGNVLSEAAHGIGLGFADRLAGGAFGFFKGAMFVTLIILTTLAFFPRAHWLETGRLPHKFFGICHLSTHMSPAELANRVRQGLKKLEDETPHWLHQDHSPDGKV